MSESRGLLLQVVLAAKDKATGPLRAIMRGGSETAAQLKKTRDALDGLKKQQRDVDGYRKTSIELTRNKRALEEATEKVTTFNKRLEDQRNKHANLKGNVTAAKTEYDRLSDALKTGTGNNAQFSREFELAKIRMLAAEQAVARSRSTMDRYKDTVQNATVKQKALSSQQTSLNEQMTGYAGRLEKAGIPLTKLGIKSKALTASMAETNAVLDKQKAKLDALRGAQNALARSKERASAMAGAGATAIANGVGLGAPLAGATRSYMGEEDATTRLKNSMMRADRSVGPEFKQINDLAKELGTRLPGTTAEFVEMMSTLRSQGASAKSILDGVGESTAYLGVLLKMPFNEAAGFASKLQDATQSSAAEMEALMDQIQRTKNMGVDPTNMLQGISKVAPAMDILRTKGIAFAKEITPLLVMMDQSGMAGEASGNAMRKVFQASVDAKRRGKANDELSGTGVSLDLSNGKGEFGGMQKMFAELDKLKQLTSEKRGAVIKAMFGDDAETLQVVNTMMSKGAAGYAATLASMQEQASLRDRVNELLGTLGNKTEAAAGSWNAVAVVAGEALAPLLKDLVDWAGSAANSLRAFMEEHPILTKVILYTVAAMATMMLVAGTLLVTIAGFIGPLAMLKYGFFLVKGALVALRVAAMGHPVIAMAMGLAAVAMLIYANWEPIKAFFSDLWDGIKAVFNATIDWITNKFNAWFDKIKAGIAWLREAMGGDGQVSVSGAVDVRPPLSAAAVNGRPVQMSIGPTTANIYAAPGMDEKDMLNKFKRMMDDRDREARAKARGNLFDSYYGGPAR